MFRFVIAVVAVALGIVVLVADIAIGLQMLPPRPPGNPGQKTPEEERLILEACVAFFGIVYASGKLLYRWLGARSEELELRQWSSWHMMILNIVGGVWLILSGWRGMQLAFLRPAMFVGLLLFVLTAYEAYEKLRLSRGESPRAD
jgi:hypothetical protein